MIRSVLKNYKQHHPDADIKVYRYNSVSIRIRIVDPSFQGESRSDREDGIWKILEKLPDEVQADITLLLLFTPKEAKTSFANMEFDHPVPSVLP